jgi:TRAP-type mannitol/chloroaromatic compound transport system substrate-binding protein
MKSLSVLCVVVVMFTAIGFSQTSTAAPGQPFVAEYYYKVKWGHGDEFVQLFKKNHYPVLKKEIEMGRLLKVTMDTPRYHMTEDARWDYRVTIVFKNATLANEPFDEAALQKQLYPDQDTFKREEQRRFEILDAHWDLPVKAVDLDAK